MGWVRDGAYEHEGWVANVLADGREATAVTGGGVIVHELTGDDVIAGRQVRRYQGSKHLDVIVPWDQVATWSVRCQCGWTGSQQPARTAPGTPPDGYRDHDAIPEVEEAFATEWSAHVEPYVALYDLEQLVDELHTIEHRIDDKVQSARQTGASWSQIGRAAGLTKQGAQQRWNHLTPTGATTG